VKDEVDWFNARYYAAMLQLTPRPRGRLSGGRHVHLYESTAAHGVALRVYTPSVVGTHSLGATPYKEVGRGVE